MNRNVPIRTLNVNGLNYPIKRHSVAVCIRKNDPCICCLQDTHIRTKDLQSESEGLEKIFHANGYKQKACIAKFLTEKIDIKTKVIMRDKAYYCIIIKGSIE